MNRSETSNAASPDGPNALVIACSDYRWRIALDTFCTGSLGLKTWDSIYVPGGIYMVSYPGALPLKYTVGSQMVEFLTAQHSPKRVVLVNHEGCARYQASLDLPSGRTMPEQQESDLTKVAQWLAEKFPAIRIDAYYASGPPAEGGDFHEVVVINGTVETP